MMHSLTDLINGIGVCVRRISGRKVIKTFWSEILLRSKKASRMTGNTYIFFGFTTSTQMKKNVH